VRKCSVRRRLINKILDSLGSSSACTDNPSRRTEGYFKEPTRRMSTFHEMLTILDRDSKIARIPRAKLKSRSIGTETRGGKSTQGAGRARSAMRENRSCRYAPSSEKRRKSETSPWGIPYIRCVRCAHGASRRARRARGVRPEVALYARARIPV